jgi:hypothetical protein
MRERSRKEITKYIDNESRERVKKRRDKNIQKT